MLIAVEADRRDLESSAALRIYLLVGVDQDVGHRGIGEQRFDRSETEDLVLDVEDDLLALVGIQRHLRFADQAIDQQAQLLAKAVRRQRPHDLEVDPIQQLRLDFGPKRLVGSTTDASRLRVGRRRGHMD